jgi:glutathione peroxidase
MKIRRILACLAAALPGLAAAAPASPGACPALLDRSFPRLQDEKPQNLCQYAGKVLLVVNTASFCGYTTQYKALEALHARYAPRGLVVLGFPSNDFGAQEPGSAQEIAEFCENTFGVRFPQRNELFADLARRTGQSPRWNFHKYLIARDGTTVSSWASAVDPGSREFAQEIEKMLARQN